ncbi:MAG: hypothetical protein JRG96_18585 [Deltaproteobacteria bacterium]|nr:hypothetical protein [Deltaproteobacteria bacterium]
MISAWDDFPVHQTSQPVRFVGTSDRNFYDRYYFNLHASSDELFMIMGMGQYPNLAVQDAFACVRRGEKQYVVRASKELGDRMDLGVGPFGIEVVKPLEELRFVLEENEHGIAGDLHWRGSIPAVEEQNQFLRRHGRVFFDTSRLAQTGTWEGWLRVGDERFEVTPDRWWGTRDRSWGVRPHGEPEPEGIHAGGPGSLNGMWNYFPMQFADHSILYIRNEENDGTLALHESRRIWRDSERPIEELGPVEYEHHLEPGTRMMTGSLLRFPEAPGGPLEVKCEPLTHTFIGIGTGYTHIEPDWRHGMYQGPLVVQGREYEVADIATLGQLILVDHCARYSYQGNVGYGLYEHGFIGPFEKYGMKDRADGAA